MAHQDYLFVGTHGHVLAIAKADGKKVWERSLPNTGYAVVSIVYEEGRLFCGTGGRAFCLDPETGEIVWTNHLNGLGMGLVFLTTANSNDTEAVMSLLAHEVKSQKGATAGTGG